MPAERVTFEIKEAGLLDGTDRPIPTLLRLRDLGVRLSVDDFGTGNSSLAYLRRLPVHEVKVDNSFVQGMATDPGDLAIVNAIVTLSQQFGLTVVAEGVESELTLELLQDIGCEIGAGLPLQPAAAVRAAGGVVRRPDRDRIAGACGRPAPAGCRVGSRTLHGWAACVITALTRAFVPCLAVVAGPGDPISPRGRGRVLLPLRGLREIAQGPLSSVGRASPW